METVTDKAVKDFADKVIDAANKVFAGHMIEPENIDVEKAKSFDAWAKRKSVAVKNPFINIKLRRDTIEHMITTYEFLVWNNIGEDKKECRKILTALKKALSCVK